MAKDLARFDPFAGLEAFRRDFFDEHLLRSLHGKIPTTDVYTEDDKTLVVEAHLPNFEQKNIMVNIDDDNLVIQAERHETDQDKKKKYITRETSSSFYRSFILPDHADKAEVSADFNDGVLKVTVPLKAVATPRKISIGTRTT